MLALPSAAFHLQSASSIDIRRRVDLPLSRRGTEPAEPTTISTTHDRQPPEGQYLVERLITKRKIVRVTMHV